MNSYKINSIVEEIYNLHFLRDKNIVPKSVNISLETQKRALSNQEKSLYISHLPIRNDSMTEKQLYDDMNGQMNELILQNKNFDYLNWRNSCFLPKIDKLLDRPIYMPREKITFYNDELNKFGDPKILYKSLKSFSLKLNILSFIQ